MGLLVSRAPLGTSAAAQAGPRDVARRAAGARSRRRRKTIRVARRLPASGPLSFGQFDGKNVECAYHGWQFDAHTGQCRAIPSLTDDSKLKCDRIYAGDFPCAERDGYVQGRS